MVDGLSHHLPWFIGIPTVANWCRILQPSTVATKNDTFIDDVLKSMKHVKQKIYQSCEKMLGIAIFAMATSMVVACWPADLRAAQEVERMVALGRAQEVDLVAKNQGLLHCRRLKTMGMGRKMSKMLEYFMEIADVHPKVARIDVNHLPF